MQTSLIPINDEYVSRDDESEAALYKDVSGNGDVILTSNDVSDYALNDFGLGLTFVDDTPPPAYKK